MKSFSFRWECRALSCGVMVRDFFFPKPMDGYIGEFVDEEGGRFVINVECVNGVYFLQARRVLFLWWHSVYYVSEIDEGMYGMLLKRSLRSSVRRSAMYHVMKSFGLYLNKR